MSSLNFSVSPCLRGGFSSDSSDDLVTALRIFRPPVDVVVTMQDGKPASITLPQE